MMDEKTKKESDRGRKEEIEGKRNGTNGYRRTSARRKNHTDPATGVQHVSAAFSRAGCGADRENGYYKSKERRRPSVSKKGGDPRITPCVPQEKRRTVYGGGQPDRNRGTACAQSGKGQNDCCPKKRKKLFHSESVLCDFQPDMADFTAISPGYFQNNT